MSGRRLNWDKAKWEGKLGPGISEREEEEAALQKLAASKPRRGNLITKQEYELAKREKRHAIPKKKIP